MVWFYSLIQNIYFYVFFYYYYYFFLYYIFLIVSDRGRRHRFSGGGVMCHERDGRNKFENNNSRNDSDTVRTLYSNQRCASGGRGSSVEFTENLGVWGGRGWKKNEKLKIDLSLEVYIYIYTHYYYYYYIIPIEQTAGTPFVQQRTVLTKYNKQRQTTRIICRIAGV